MGYYEILWYISMRFASRLVILSNLVMWQAVSFP